MPAANSSKTRHQRHLLACQLLTAARQGHQLSCQLLYNSKEKGMTYSQEEDKDTYFHVSCYQQGKGHNLWSGGRQECLPACYLPAGKGMVGLKETCWDIWRSINIVQEMYCVVDVCTLLRDAQYISHKLLTTQNK